MNAAMKLAFDIAAPRFHCPLTLVAGSTIELPEATFHHAVRVRRLGIGDSLTLFSGDGHEARARLVSIRRDRADALIEQTIDFDRESPLRVSLLQGISSGDRMDYTLQKAAELGIRSIIPVASDRSQRSAAPRAEKRATHWREVVISACEQSGRNRIPDVADASTLAAALASTSAATRLLLSTNGGARLRELPPPSGSIALLAGPEGGLSNDEEMLAKRAGFTAVSLGPRILRTETAAVAALAAIQALWGDG